MKPIRLTIGGDEFAGNSELLIEDRGTGMDIRHAKAAICDAASHAAVDIDIGHCNACGTSVAELLGLSLDEVTKIRKWRTRKEDGVTSTELGAVLDKIASGLTTQHGRDCHKDSNRIVLEVEDVYG